KLKKLEKSDKVVDLLEGWVEFLRDPESEVVRKLEMSNIEIREAKDELYRLSRSSKERELYFMREKSLKDEMSALANAEEKGIQKGIEKGMQKGREEEKISIARNMILNGISSEIISNITGLTIEEIDNIR
ncbi:MAG: Rpn family recombination-promoting nuclease/putative transposase, partial [Romboutsia sp.]